MIVRTSTDLPDPDSPTIPSVRPSARSNVTPSTALTRPPGVSNAVRRLRTWSNGGFSSGVTAHHRSAATCGRPPSSAVDRRPVHHVRPGGRGGSTGAGPTDPRRRGRTRSPGSGRSHRSAPTRARPAATAADAAAHHPRRREGDDHRHRYPPRERPPRAHSGAGPDNPTVHEVLSGCLTGTSGHEHDLVHGPEHHTDEDREGGRASRSAAGPMRPVGRRARGLAARSSVQSTVATITTSAVRAATRRHSVADGRA